MLLPVEATSQVRPNVLPLLTTLLPTPDRITRFCPDVFSLFTPSYLASPAAEMPGERAWGKVCSNLNGRSGGGHLHRTRLTASLLNVLGTWPVPIQLSSWEETEDLVQH